MAKKSTKKTSQEAPEEKPRLIVSEHALVPKHELVSDSEKQKILAQYKISPKELPRIKINDAAIRHLGIKEGDLIKITRESPTAGTAIFYRIVTRE